MQSPMNQRNTEPMHRIIRLKRYEHPPEGYVEGFLKEFHYRQRAELLKPSLSALLWERLLSLIPEVRVPALAYAGATAVAVVAGVAILNHPESSRGAATAPSFASYPVTIQKMQPVSLRVDPASPQGTAAAFPPSFFLQGRQATHESPLSF
jgi:hypothetical protein